MRERRIGSKGVAAAMLCLMLPATMITSRTCGAGFEDWSVVPGTRIGQVRLGMTRSELHRRLGPPNATVRRRSESLVERWRSKSASEKSEKLHFKADFTTVYYRSDRVVQVDVSSPAFKLSNGLSTRNSAQDFQLQCRPDTLEEMSRQYRHGDPDGVPAGKHFVRYGDDARQGLGWRYGWWGNLAPDGDPSTPLETLIVHRAGKALLLDPDGTEALTITGADVIKRSHSARKL